MKMAPLLRAIDSGTEFRATLIHTGQHYDASLSDIFFDQLDMRRPDISLEVGSGSQAIQTARILERIEPVLQAGPAGEPSGSRFDALVVVGDVNSTMASAIAAAKLGIKVVHIEAGLRSFDRTMPEEINRIVTDSISDLLLVSDPAGIDHLKREGHADDNIVLVGNLMIDTLLHSLEKSKLTTVLEDNQLKPKEYGVVTLHRPSNVDDKTVLQSILKVLVQVSERLPLVFAVHPRTLARMQSFGLLTLLEACDRIKVLPPQGYLEFLALTSSAKVVVTDSGGLQEETTVLSIPCLTMRSNTERPITVTEGSSTLIGNDAELLKQELDKVLLGKYDCGRCVPLWDGKAYQRALEAIAEIHSRKWCRG
jgi:UDP-N-acetylglucosamine 2-epimerase (non-hydrolysing)